MHTARLSVVAILSSFALAGAFVQAAETYQIDPAHSAFLFRIKHISVSYTHGRINSSSGTVVVDEADPSKSSVDLELKADSVDTFNEKRDQHLKGPDFFNAKQFPTITFKSKSIKKSGDDYEVTGDFTMLGVTKEITAKFTRTGGGKTPFGDFRVGFEGTATIKRSDFGMKTMLEAVGDDVDLTIGIEAAHK